MLNHIGTKTIETERLILRKFEYLDIESMIRNWIADEKTQWNYGEPNYSTAREVKELFDMFLKRTGQTSEAAVSIVSFLMRACVMCVCI